MFNILGLLVAFSIIIVLVRKEKSFGFSMLLASLVLAFFSQENLTLHETVLVFKNGVLSVDTISLTIGVAFMGILANSMKETGEIESIILNLRSIIPKEGVLASIPAVFGLLPIPGGALMSAPMIDEQGSQLNVPISGRVFLNLWFRHIGFLIFPLSAPLLLLAHEAGIGLHLLILIQIPIFLVALVVGIVVLAGETRKSTQLEDVDPIEKKSNYSLFKSLSPILTSILIFFLLSYLTKLSFYSSLVISVPGGIAISLFIGKSRVGNVFKIIKEGFSVDMAVAVFGIMIFYKVVQSSGLAETLADVFIGSFLPLPIFILIISFLLGFSMGHNLGAVGVGYSVLASAIGGSIPLISLIYVSSFMGYLISPIHLCVAVSYEYFDPDIVDFYKVYIPPAIVVLAISTAFLLMLS